MKRSDSEIENILNSFDGIQRAEPAPFMYTRIRGLLQNQEKSIWERVGFFIAKPVVVLTCFLAILAANYYIITKNDNSGETAITSMSNSASEILQNDSYILAVNNYEFNPQP